MRESHESIGIADITRIAKGILARGASTQQGVLATCSSHIMRAVTLTLPYSTKGEEDDGEDTVDLRLSTVSFSAV